MIGNRFFTHSFFAAVLVMIMASGCSHSTSSSPAPAFPATSILDTGSVITFLYSTGDSLSQSINYRVIVDSAHRSLGNKNNVSFWGDGSSSSVTINYDSQGFQVLPSALFFSYTGISDWASFPFGYGGEVIETRRIDTSFTQSGQFETATLRDSLHNFGTGYVRVGGEQMVTVHYQGTEDIVESVPQLQVSQTNHITVDYWYAPLAGYFVVQERTDTFQPSRERLEIVAFSPN